MSFRIQHHGAQRPERLFKGQGAPRQGYGRNFRREPTTVAHSRFTARTAASGMAALGFQPHVIERVLNHVSGAQGGLVGVYQRHEYRLEQREILNRWSSYLDLLAG